MCWSGRWDRRDWEFQRRPIERRPAERRPRPDVRVSDAEREATIDQLSRHTGDGRLTLEEFESRVDEAWQATTRGELQHVLRELPVERTRTPRQHLDPQLRRTAAWLLIIVGAALLIGPWSLWWLIPLAWFKFGAFGHHHSRRYDEPHELPPTRDELTVV